VSRNERPGPWQPASKTSCRRSASRPRPAPARCAARPACPARSAPRSPKWPPTWSHRLPAGVESGQRADVHRRGDRPVRRAGGSSGRCSTPRNAFSAPRATACCYKTSAPTQAFLLRPPVRKRVDAVLSLLIPDEAEGLALPSLGVPLATTVGAPRPASTTGPERRLGLVLRHTTAPPRPREGRWNSRYSPRAAPRPAAPPSPRGTPMPCHP
jgi:hypothetical protein